MRGDCGSLHLDAVDWSRQGVGALVVFSPCGLGLLSLLDQQLFNFIFSPFVPI